jgi:hypothetical protein
MKIAKKVKCVHCQSVVEHSGACTCGKVKLTNGTITEGSLGRDYVDISAQLLTEYA